MTSQIGVYYVRTFWIFLPHVTSLALASKSEHKLFTHKCVNMANAPFRHVSCSASQMTYKFAQGLEQWLVKGHTCRVASLRDPDPERIYITVSCSLTRAWVPLSHCSINILSQQYKRSPSICISLETLLTSSWERPSVRTTRTLGMALRAPASAVKMDSFTCFMARPNARQQENTESIQIPAFHFVSAPVTSDTVLYRTPDVCDGVFSSPLSFVRKSYIKRTRSKCSGFPWIVRLASAVFNIWFTLTGAFVYRISRSGAQQGY